MRPLIRWSFADESAEEENCPDWSTSRSAMVCHRVFCLSSSSFSRCLLPVALMVRAPRGGTALPLATGRSSLLEALLERL